nr:MAG TPA: diacylgycerol kinase [Caudoviricetes sp.]
MMDSLVTRYRLEYIMLKHPTNISERELEKEDEAAKEGIQGFFWFGQFIPCVIIGGDGMINWQHKLNKF